MQHQRGHHDVDPAGRHEPQWLLKIGHLDPGAVSKPAPGQFDELWLAVDRKDVSSPVGELGGQHPARAAEFEHALACYIASEAQDRRTVILGVRRTALTEPCIQLSVVPVNRLASHPLHPRFRWTAPPAMMIA